jgi:hypothetical protein
MSRSWNPTRDFRYVIKFKMSEPTYDFSHMSLQEKIEFLRSFELLDDIDIDQIDYFMSLLYKTKWVRVGLYLQSHLGF